MKSRSFIDREFALAQRIIIEETGITPMILRPPYGLRWAGMADIQRKLSLLGVMWTVIGNDWAWPADRIAAHITERASPGGIVCLHDGRDVQPNADIRETVKAVRTIVPILKDAGYSFEIVSDLINP
jgi:peptidoglycan/xylan/chitin deacetylase (PgdA/CDA1 family)